MIARSHKWIVTDFYPDKTGRLPVILYNAERAERKDVHVFIIVRVPATPMSSAICIPVGAAMNVWSP